MVRGGEMSGYYMQHHGNEINKIMDVTGKNEDVLPEPDTENDKVEIITEHEHRLLQACKGNLDYLLVMVMRLTELVGK
jgi:hypothetical protein